MGRALWARTTSVDLTIDLGLCNLAVLDRLGLFVLTMAGLDFDLSGFHGFGYFALQFDLEQSVLKRDGRAGTAEVFFYPARSFSTLITSAGS